MPVGPHAGERALDEPRPLLLRERRQRVPLGRTEVEGLLDEQRLVEEVGLGATRSAPSVPAEIAQREQGLEAGDTTAHDHDPAFSCVRVLAQFRRLPSDRGNKLSSQPRNES